jgi:hypothetical protein
MRYRLPREHMMQFQVLECVVLTRNLPEQGLCRGDLGAVVEVHEPDGLEVEFVAASGATQAVVTLRITDVRKIQPGDIVAVRQLVS